jgi:pyruvate kinase
MARNIALYRPKQPIIVCSDNMTVVRQCNMSRGSTGYFIPTFQGREELLHRTVSAFRDSGFCKPGDKVIAVYGTHEMHPEQSNIMNVLEVP